MSRRPSLIKDLILICSKLHWAWGLSISFSVFVTFSYVVPFFLEGMAAQVLSLPLYWFGVVLASASVLGTGVGLLERFKQYRLYLKQKEQLDLEALDWREFEHLLTETFRRQGYKSTLTRGQRDGGVDIRLEKGGETVLVQCKHWQTKKVGVTPVRELAGVVAVEKASRGIIVCSGSFTTDAIKFAESAQIEVIDGPQLKSLFSSVHSERSERLSQDGCPRCGRTLVHRVAKRGARKGQRFWGCSGFPACRFTISV